MTNTEHDPASLLADLEVLRSRSKLKSRKGGHTQLRVFITATERAGLSALRGTLSLHVGRTVSQPLVARLALNLLAERCTRSLSDPVEAARLRAELLAVRDERLGELRAAR